MQCAREGYVLASSRTASSKADRPPTTHTKVQCKQLGGGGGGRQHSSGSPGLEQKYIGYYCLYYRCLLIPSCWWGRGRRRMVLRRSSQTVWLTLLRPKYMCGVGGLVGVSLSVDNCLQVSQLCVMMEECSEGVRQGEEKAVATLKKIAQTLFSLLNDTTR